MVSNSDCYNWYMRITDIRQQKKRQDRYSIYIDGKFGFGLSEAQLAELGLRRDQELTEAEFNRLRHQAEWGRAYERATRYLAIRPRSRWEMETYLKRKGYNAKIVRSIKDKLTELGLINDTEFARAWVEYRSHSVTRSRRKIASELIAKRVDREVIDEVMAELSDADDLAKIRNLIERKSRLSQYQDRQKLLAYLARQGFDYGLIKQALSEADT